MRRWPFLKAHGLGNDFLLHRQTAAAPAPTPAEVRRLCDRRAGYGADGVLLLAPRLGGDSVSMTLFNADGQLAEISGNGLRCAVAAWCCWWGGPGHSTHLEVHTGAGLRHGRLLPVAGDASWPPGELEVEVEMGRPRFDAVDLPLAAGVALEADGSLLVSVAGQTVRGWPVNVGNPHFVIPGPLPESLAVGQLGPVIEHHPDFPTRINVIWAERRPAGLALQIWERGCGPTLACGSGATAASAVAQRLGWFAAGAGVRVAMAGGEATVHLPAAADLPLRLRGPVALVGMGEAFLSAADRG